MKLIAALDQHKLGLFDGTDSEISYTRRAARAVLVDSENRVAVMYFTNTGSHKLPGGGIDEGESVETALRREIREETGYEITDIKELGIVEEDRYYTGMHQTSYCFQAVVTTFVGTALTDKELSEGMELHWLDSIEAAIEAVQASALVDEDKSAIGLEMMKRREVAILQSATK